MLAEPKQPKVTWSKPRLLGKEELRPFLTANEAAFKMQQLHRNWKAREIARDAMRVAWNRVYSPQVQLTAPPSPPFLSLFASSTLGAGRGVISTELKHRARRVIFKENIVC